MKKFVVDQEKCIGCGASVAIDNTHFDFDDNGLSHVINNENIDEAQANDIVDVCPTGAIKYDECHCQDGEECICGDDCDCSDGCNCKETGECNCGDNCDCGEDCPCHSEQ